MNVKEAHEHEHQGNQAKYSFRAHVTFSTHLLSLIRGALAQFTESFTETLGEAGSHFVQGVGRSYQHAADGYGTHNESPNGGGDGGPIVRSVSGKKFFELRAEKKDHERDH